MRRILDEIQSGKFADEWIAENENGRPNYKALQAKGQRALPSRRSVPSAGHDALDLRRQGQAPGRQRRLAPTPVPTRSEYSAL